MLNSIQILRALAAWLVVGHHVMQIFYNFNSGNFLTHFFSKWGGMGVDIFFVVSGFVIFISSDRKQKSRVDFIRNRLVRIVPAYWASTMITLLFVLLLPGLAQEMRFIFSGAHILSSFLFVPWIHPGGFGYFPVVTMGWTLNFEMMFYLIFALALGFSKQRRIAIVALGILLVFFVLPSVGVISPFYNNNIALEFFAGVGVGSFWSKGKVIPSLKKGIFFFASAIALMILLQDAEGVFRCGVPSVCIVLGALYVEKSIKKSVVLSKLGDLSYSTYLFHGIVLYLAVYSKQYIQMPDALLIALSCGLILLVSYLSYHFLELQVRNRFQRKSSGLKSNLSN